MLGKYSTTGYVLSSFCVLYFDSKLPELEPTLDPKLALSLLWIPGWPEVCSGSQAGLEFALDPRLALSLLWIPGWP